MKYSVQLVRAEASTPDGIAEKTGDWINALAKSFGEPISITAISEMEGKLGRMTLHTLVLFKSE